MGQNFTMAIKAVSFDLWDTVFIDDSDEPKRKSMGLLPKKEERRKLVLDFLKKSATISPEKVNEAYNATDAEFRRAWYEKGITWTVNERLLVLFKKLNRKIPDNDFNELVKLHEEMELNIQPDFAEGISDAIFSPGRVLKEILASKDLLKYFEAFVFSDEIGCSKPNPLVFETIVKKLKIELTELIHVGDREEKDIEGPHIVGSKAILTTVIKDRGSKNTKADAICTNYKDLASIINKLNITNNK